jgi:hypothetical protein
MIKDCMQRLPVFLEFSGILPEKSSMAENYTEKSDMDLNSTADR